MFLNLSKTGICTFFGTTFYSSALSSLFMLTLTSPSAIAELKPLADTEMSDVVGQAYIQVDQVQHPTQNIEYVRTQLGADIEMQINADLMELGRYPRWDEKRNDWEVQPADILIEDYAMGHIYDSTYYLTNPLVPVPKKADGSSYKDGEIVPFRIVDPYFEVAYETVDGQTTPIGFRTGYGGAEGTLSGTILSLTGKVDSRIKTNANYLANQVGACDATPELCSALGIDPLLGDVEIANDAHLVYGKDESNPDYLVGELDEARAMFTGIKNGDSMTADTSLASVSMEAQNCTIAVAADVCFPLSQYQTLWIGKRDEYGNIAGPAEGMFLSFQTKALDWQKDIKQGMSADNLMTTVQGAFLNVPSGAQEIDLIDATLGTARARTEYIDRGVGLF